MAINQYLRFPTKTNAPSAAYPYGSARNVSVPGDGTGTPWEQAVVNDLWGWMQQLLDSAGIVPTNDPDEVGASQYFTAMRAAGGFPGLIVPMALNDDPATLGVRILLLDGSVILRANYADLDANVYCGDSANETADAFFHCEDPSGAFRDPAGNYLVLADARGRFPRGLDTSGTIDPDGATRILGDEQDWALRTHHHFVGSGQSNKFYNLALFDTVLADQYEMLYRDTGTLDSSDAIAMDIATYTVPALNQSDDESRPVNFCVNWGIWY